jgi:alkylated DNA repair dioxygenase AlkB
MTTMQLGLFAMGGPSVDAGARAERVDLAGGAWVEVRRGWFQGADDLCHMLIGTVPWEHHRRWMYDRVVDEPRLSRWYRDAAELPGPGLVEAAQHLSALYDRPLVGPSLNYYRDGRDSVAFHADRELRFLDDTVVAIVTLGATRPFLVRPQGGGRSIDFRPGAGDLLVMGGACQLFYEHAVPKVAYSGPRVSASWRWAWRPGR